MNVPWVTLRIVAWNELADSVRSRRVLVIVLLYLACALWGTKLFVDTLRVLESELAQTLGLAEPKKAGGVTASLWQSESFRRTLKKLLGDEELVTHLLGAPPLALFYGWLALTFTPLLVMLTASTRIAEEVASGSARFVMFRTTRSLWCLGKFAGQALQIFGALLISAAGTWVLGLIHMQTFEPLAAMLHMLGYACKAWLYALPFLGVALAVSQWMSSPNLAVVVGLMVMFVMSLVRWIGRFAEGSDTAALWQTVALLTPSAYRHHLWWNDLSRLAPAVLLLGILTTAYLLAGHTRFGRRDL
ncbi:MAG: ABC transporter permease subunit [Verrucomicrobiae bacterium]|nr:ABC transporter permease subunit [Verrucomicrobiae bacterium]